MIEYKHISKFLGKDRLWVTNVKNLSGQEELKEYATVITEPTVDLKLKNVCVLDPEGTEVLTPEDAKSIDYYLFGGILGGYPPRKRTEKELTKFLPKDYVVRHLGPMQMPTDSAVYTVNEIHNGKKFEDIPFFDKPEHKINQYEIVQIPMRYVNVNGKPLISAELLDHWSKSDDSDQRFGLYNANEDVPKDEEEEEEDEEEEEVEEDE